MKTEYAEIEVWVIVNESGEYDVGTDCDNAAERYAENIGGETGAVGIRQVRVTLKVPLPKVIELNAEVTAEETAEIKVA